MGELFERPKLFSFEKNSTETIFGEVNFSSPGNLYEADSVNGNKKGVEFLIQRIKDWRPKK